MAEQTSLIRKPTPAEELAKLHPVERVLLCAFEFLSSIKLAVTLMSWLIIECTTGTFIESQVNTPAAQYFVYQSWRFVILLSLLGLNILCAALIRFPWKKSQTGFVVTHSGLLVLLFGSMMTWKSNLDSLMTVRKDHSESTIFDPDDQQLVVEYFDRKDQSSGPSESYTLPVWFGPYSWGHKIFGTIPWMEGRTKSSASKTGDTLRVKSFFANSEPRYLAPLSALSQRGRL